jgi:DNA-binding helix-hairpin-helix protein with protein kinase domain
VTYFAPNLNRNLTPSPPLFVGGEAEVSHCREALELLLKILHQPPDAMYGQRIDYLGDHGNRVGRDRLTFPVSRLCESKSGSVVGCVLQKVDGISLGDVLNPRWRSDRGADLTDSERVFLALEYAKNLALVHERKLVRSDGNLNNELVTLDNSGNPKGLISIDLDSYGHVAVRGPTGVIVDLPATIGVEDYSAPELLTGQAVATFESDRFLAALALWTILTDEHATAGILDATSPNYDPAERIRRGLFPALRIDPKTGLSTKSHGTGLRPEDWPASVRNLFFDALVTGHAGPAERPTLADWVTELSGWHKHLARPRLRKPAGLLKPMFVGAAIGAGLGGLYFAKQWVASATPSAPGPTLWRTLR